MTEQQGSTRAVLGAIADVFGATWEVYWRARQQTQPLDDLQREECLSIAKRALLLVYGQVPGFPLGDPWQDDKRNRATNATVGLLVLLVEEVLMVGLQSRAPELTLRGPKEWRVVMKRFRVDPWLRAQGCRLAPSLRRLPRLPERLGVGREPDDLRTTLTDGAVSKVRDYFRLADAVRAGDDAELERILASGYLASIPPALRWVCLGERFVDAERTRRMDIAGGIGLSRYVNGAMVMLSLARDVEELRSLPLPSTADVYAFAEAVSATAFLP